MVEAEAVTHAAIFLSNGSISAVIAMLLLVILALLWERMRILKKIDILTDKFLQAKKDEMTSIKDLITLYYNGNISLVQTLTEIKSVLSNIQPYRR